MTAGFGFGRSPRNFMKRMRRNVGIGVGVVRLIVASMLATIAAAAMAFAQATPTSATLTEWDVFAATGGGSTASQNVGAVLMDVSGKAGTAGSVWLTTQSPLP